LSIFFLKNLTRGPRPPAPPPGLALCSRPRTPLPMANFYYTKLKPLVKSQLAPASCPDAIFTGAPPSPAVPYAGLARKLPASFPSSSLFTCSERLIQWHRPPACEKIDCRTWPPTGRRPVPLMPRMVFLSFPNCTWERLFWSKLSLDTLSLCLFTWI